MPVPENEPGFRDLDDVGPSELTETVVRRDDGDDGLLARKTPPGWLWLTAIAAAVGVYFAAVSAHDFILHFKDGYETVIGERGVTLSGGQRQRVALARALFMDPEILILDEATSSLDVQSDLLIQETIKNLKKDFTIIIVTHKISSVKFADMICVLENGKACEVGSYSELQAKKGKFHQLETLQKEPIYMK